MDSVLLSTHAGFISSEHYEAFYRQTAENFPNIIQGGNVKVLGPDKGMFDSQIYSDISKKKYAIDMKSTMQPESIVPVT